MWSGFDRDDPERWQVADAAVATTGCLNDRTNVVIRAPTLRAVSDRLAELMTEEAARGVDPARPHPDPSDAPRSRYYGHMRVMLDANQLDHRQFHQMLASWEDRHCAQFRAGGAVPAPGGGYLIPVAEQRERIAALFPPTEEELRVERVGDAVRRGAEAARAGRAPSPTPDPAGSALANAWLSGYYGELAKRAT
jgi:hypothetical protein